MTRSGLRPRSSPKPRWPSARTSSPCRRPRSGARFTGRLRLGHAGEGDHGRGAGGIDRLCRRHAMPRPDPPPNAHQVPARTGQRGRTHAVYYRDSQGHEPVNQWLEALLVAKPAAVAKIDDFMQEHLNSRRADAPLPSFRSPRRSTAACASCGFDSRTPDTACCTSAPATSSSSSMASRSTRGPSPLPTCKSPSDASQTSRPGWTLRSASALARPGMMPHPGADSSSEHRSTLTATYLD